MGLTIDDKYSIMRAYKQQQRKQHNTMNTLFIIALIAIVYEAALGNADW